MLSFIYYLQEGDDDVDDLSGPAFGGRISMDSDSDNIDEEEDDDGPPMLGNLNSIRRHLSVPNRKPFST